jgi:hypothetical protein
MALVGKYKIIMLPDAAEIDRMGVMYVSKKIIPKKYEDDALHIAAATVNKLDFVLSYNYNHIVKLKTIIGAGLINRRRATNR